MAEVYTLNWVVDWKARFDRLAFLFEQRPSRASINDPRKAFGKTLSMFREVLPLALEKLLGLSRT